jgi:Ca-activated chloride channel homolog
VTRRTALVLALLALLPATRAAAQAGLLVPTSTGHADPSVLSLREMAIDAGIGRGYARINVRQVFENHTGDIQEGTWRFALPRSGAVGDFAVWDGLTRIPGVILEKRRARAIYRDLTAQRIDPGLLQQGEEEDREPGASGRASDRPSGGALFSVKVAPIPAWGTKRLELQYQQEVPWVDGVGELRIPLRPTDGEPMTAATFTVRVVLLDGALAPPAASAFVLERKEREATFSGSNVKLGSDIVVRFTPSSTAPLTLSAFRNPAGALPDGLALAPWERPSDVPPEKDGFFLLEYWPKKAAPARKEEPRTDPAARDPLSFALLFDTSLSHRWGGLETAYAALVRLLDALSPEDRFVLVAFDRAPAPDPSGLAAAAPAARQAALSYLKSRPLAPGTDIISAVKAARRLLAEAPPGAGRIVLFTDGAGPVSGLDAARGGLPLFTVITGEERREAFTAASAASVSLTAPTALAEESAEATLFFRRVLARERKAEAPRAEAARAPLALPFAVTGGDPKLRDVYPVLTQPPTAGSLSGWVGRYAAPVASATLTLGDAPGTPSVTAAFPEAALEARDLPRRWARARVDELLRLIELGGEKREWVEEIIALSRRFKFVTPYTAFLAAPRSLLRPRRIQPGDPLIRVEADRGVVAVTALLPFGKEVGLVRRPGTGLWEGRFLVPEGLPDGPIALRLVLRDVSGKTLVEAKRLVIDGTPPRILPDTPEAAVAGRSLRVAARADSDVVFLSARLGGGAPVPLRWDGASKRSVAEILVPPGTAGLQELFFEATDGAGNHGFARVKVEVR